MADSSSARGDGQSSGFRAGLVTLIGRANVGKSTLVNAIVGQKVSIVSDKPQTTRAPVRAVLNLDGSQAVFVDTPGLHKPRTLLGQQLNRAALDALDGVDVVALVVDAKAGVGGGDRWVNEHLPRRDICVVNKIDGMPRAAVLAQLSEVGEWGFGEYFAVSARTGAGVPDLIGALVGRLPESPHLYPLQSEPSVTAEPEWVAELVREQLLALTARSCPTASPAGSRSGNGHISAARSWSNGSRRRVSSSATAGRSSSASAPPCVPSCRLAPMWSFRCEWCRTGSTSRRR